MNWALCSVRDKFGNRFGRVPNAYVFIIGIDLDFYGHRKFSIYIFN